MKQKIVRGKNIVPAITFVVYVSHGKLASKDFRTNELSYDLTLAFENALSETISAAYNFGTVENLRNYRSSANFGFSLFGDASLFVEYFARFPEKSKAEHNLISEYCTF